MKKKQNRCAIYCRLSIDDGVDQVSQSITNQKEILQEYCINNNFTIENIYIDDGYSGTNFDRPAFKEMIEHIEQGLIDIVITKDLSRLGRDYLTTGIYTEQYFPEHNIRYIALNDHVDTSQGLDDMVPLKNIINEFYARDISKKIRFTITNNQMRGESKRTPTPLYGYMYDAKSQRVINPKTAEVVRTIYKLFLEGNSFKQISDKLSDMQVRTPLSGTNHICSNDEKKYKWAYSTIKNILTNEEYLGHYVTKKTTKRFKTGKKIVVPKEERYVFKNKFSAIVTEEEFNMVQDLINTKANIIDDSLKKNPYSGLCKCGICGHKMTYVNHKSSKGFPDERICCMGKENNKGSIMMNELKTVITSELLKLREIVLAHKNEFLIEAKNKAGLVKTSSRTLAEEAKYQNLLNRREELNRFIRTLTEQLTNKLIPEAAYKMMVTEYTEELDTVEASIKRFKIFEERQDIKLERQAELLIETLEKLTQYDINSQVFIRNMISEIVITSFPLEGTMRKGKNITIKYKYASGFVNEFIEGSDPIHAAI